MAAALMSNAVINAIQKLQLRNHADISEETAVLEKIAKILKNAPCDEQLARLHESSIHFEAGFGSDLSNPVVRRTLNLGHTDVFPAEKLDELAKDLKIDTNATVLNEFNPAIRKAMKLPHAGPRLIVSQFFARYRVAENKSFTEGADRSKNIEESASSPLSIHHINDVLTHVVKNYIDDADLPHYVPCKYEQRDSYFSVIAAIVERGTEQQIEELTHHLVRALVDVYYTSARPEVYELFSHMAANELMIVDGDSLILTAMNNANVDWDLMQSVHVAYLVNKFIADLKNRGAKIHILFFQCHEWFWAKAPQKRLIRNVIKSLLSTRAEQPDAPFAFFEFATYNTTPIATQDGSFKSTAFKRYLDIHSPEFIVLNDGEEFYPAAVNELHVVDPSATTPAAFANPVANAGKPFVSTLGCSEHGAKAAAALHRMAIHLVANRIHVVYSNRQIHKDNNVFGFTVRAYSALFVPFEPLCAILEQQNKSDRVENQYDPALEDVDSDIVNALSGDNLKSNPLLSLCAAAKYLVDSGEADAETLAVLKAAIFTLISQPQLGVDARYQNIDSANPQAKRFVEIVSTIAGLMADVIDTFDIVRAGDYDAFDAHLIAANAILLKTVPANKLVSAALVDRVNEAWAAITGDESADITSNPIADMPFVSHKPAEKVGAFHFFESELVTKLCEKFAVEPVPAGSVVKPTTADFITQSLKNFPDWKPNHDFLEYNAVIAEKEVAEKKAAEEERAARNRRYRDKLKAMEARFYAAIDEIARSMGVQESKVTTGKKSNDTAAAASSTAGHAGQRTSNTVGRTQAIQESNAVVIVLKEVDTVMERSLLKIKQCNERIHDFDPLTAGDQQRSDLMRILKDTLDFVNAIHIIRESDEAITDGAGNSAYRQLFKLAFDARSDSKLTPFQFICHKTGATTKKFGALTAMEVIAKKSADKAEALAAMEKKFARKKPTDVDTAKMQELKSQILVNEPNADRCGYFAARCFASMFQRYVIFEILISILNARAKIWRVVKTKWFSECNVLTTPAEKVAFLEDQIWTPAVDLWLIAHRVLRGIQSEPLPIPNLAQLDHVRAAIDDIDLEIYRSTIFDNAIKAALGVDSLGAVPNALRPTCNLPIEMDATNFQLRRMGERLERHVPPRPDPRVVFNADNWQRDLMDIVDTRGSAIVSAPTSSGKTFISYYCMEQVFSQTINSDTRDEDIGVVVYVAPTRALINQAAADVYGRYKSKNYGTAVQSIFGILGGRDFVRNPFDCQALITLPDVLETILLSPHNQKWLKRVKYFIFDEIHTMEDSGNGAVWERLLSLIRAPFVALSATIGDTQNLLAWLNRIQQCQGAQAAAQHLPAADPRIYNVELIPRNGATIARWSDIEKHVFIPNTTKPLASLFRDSAIKLVDKSDIVDFNPLSVVNFEMLARKDAFPADVGIVPRETVELVQQMFKAFEPICKVEYGDVPCVIDIAKRLLALSPNTFMSNLLHIPQAKAREWEFEAKKELLTWVRMGTAPGLKNMNLNLGPLAGSEDDIEAFANRMKEVCETVLSAFSANALEREQTLINKARNGEMAYPDTTDFIHSGIVRCLYTLLSRQLSPAIIFVLDQEECERLVETVVSTLEEAEAAYRSSPAFFAFERQNNLEREKNERLKASKASMTHQSEGGDENRNEGDRKVDTSASNIRPDSDFIIPAILPEFTFAPMVHSDDDLRNALEENPNERQSILFRALSRGIGLHHNGISGKLRGSVERAFRKLQLPFVFSTEGLALGIHSPCRTVVLAGDNISLNVSEFRQMAGRAGRRGLDFLGHVCFFGISFKKIKRLMTGEMANLRGHSQIDPNTFQRIWNLYHARFDNKPGKPTADEWHRDVFNIAELALVEPLFVRGREEAKDYCRDHIALMRHMMTYYAREGLINVSPTEASSIGNMMVTMLNIRNATKLETAGFSVASMIVNQTLQKTAQSDIDASRPEYIRERRTLAALAFSYVLTKHYKFGFPLEVHRSITRDALAIHLRKNVTARSHIIYLPDPSGEIKDQLAMQSRRILAVLSNYVSERARAIRADGSAIPVDTTLPLGLINANGDIITVVRTTDNAANVANLGAALRAVATQNVKARHPLIAVSGKNDTFTSIEDITQSLAKGLFLDLTDVPAIDLVDLGRHDGAPCIINACFYDYIRNGSQRRGEDFVRLHLMLYNNLSQSSSWGTLNKIFSAVDSLNVSMKEIGNVTNPTCSAIAIVAEYLRETLHNQLMNRPQWKVDARAGIAATINA